MKEWTFKSFSKVFKNYELTVDYISKYNVVSFELSIGSNKFRKRKRRNFFVSISIIFWTFEIEIEKI